MSFFRNAASIVLTSGVSIPFALATSVLLARYLSVEDRGIYYLLTAFAALGRLFSQFSGPAVSIYRIRQIHVAPSVVLSAGLASNVALGLVGIGICLVLEDPIRTSFLTSAPRAAFLAALACVPFLVMGEFLRGIAQALDRFDLSNWYGFLQNAGLLLGVLMAVVLLEGGLMSAVGVYFGVAVMLAAWLLVAVLRISGLPKAISIAEIRAGMRFGLKSYVQNLTNYLHEYLGAFVIALLLDAREVAFWGIALGSISRLGLVPSAISTALLPRLAGTATAEAGHFTAHVVRHSTIWLLLGVVVLLPVAPILIPLLYGSAYVESVPPFLWLLPMMVPLTLSRAVARYFTVLDRQEIVIATRILGIGVHVGLYIWWIPASGIVGAAQASLTTYTLEALVLLTLFLRQSGQTIRDVLLLGPDDLRPYRRHGRALWARVARLSTRRDPPR